ncbi:hypothetical protein B0I26_103334 [Anoxybacillus vitaminiphilus]|uniref:Uncharacterized protein n=1 Tax=Paranoxybacillus vitaminiphilus TaxID=581036 RepID=A0A327YLT0_9BACL|nr:hypothetical protein [Anoxybacillus vitaminiphilus]RAK21372.1 hypothetical protein B0I26_103334 [Anoxybacillus vitaminiphilus]
MIKTEKGSSLITVLLVALIFMTLGLAILSATIGGSLRTEIRKTDVDVIYQARKLMEEMIADLKIALKDPDPMYKIDLTKVNGRVNASFDVNLHNVIDKLEQAYKTNPIVKSLRIEVISSDIHYPEYNIDKETQFTRVLEIRLTVQDPDKKIERTFKRNVILSPTPSFLQYAIGSAGEGSNAGLEINGSPNILGNVFANDLKISQNAKFCPTNKFCTPNDEWLEIPTPYPSIFGDVYSQGRDLQPVLTADHFYNQKVPTLKNHSDFIDVNFPKTFHTQADELLQKIDGTLQYSDENFTTYFNSYITDFFSTSQPTLLPLSDDDDDADTVDLKDLPVTPMTVLKWKNPGQSMKLSNTSNLELSKPLKIDGDAILSNTRSLTIPSLIVNGDITITNYGDLEIGNLYATGDVTIANFRGNHSSSVKKGFVKNSMIIGGNLEIINYTDFQIGEENSSNDSFTASQSTGNVFVYGNTKFVTNNRPFTVRGNIITNGDLFILGNDDLNKNEDDDFIFDSVIYVNGQSFISNVNIFGADNNDKQLVLLSGEDLTITRINEFKNFPNMNEPDDFKGEVTDNTNTIKPLKAFFYTHENAKLYGVGSLFYIEGGLFARNHLEINAIRGGQAGNEEDLKRMAGDGNQPNLQTGKYSRFNVKYDKKVLLKRIDALPVVDYLQVIPDEIVME